MTGDRIAVAAQVQVGLVRFERMLSDTKVLNTNERATAREELSRAARASRAVLDIQEVFYDEIVADLPGVWTIFFAVSAAGYGEIWRDTGRYQEIHVDMMRYGAPTMCSRQRP